MVMYCNSPTAFVMKSVKFDKVTMSNIQCRDCFNDISYFTFLTEVFEILDSEFTNINNESYYSSTYTIVNETEMFLSMYPQLITLHLKNKTTDLDSILVDNCIFTGIKGSKGTIFQIEKEDDFTFDM